MGAFFQIEVRVPPQVAQLLTDQGKPIPDPVAGLALIDTGATMTCVHEPILQQLGLNPIDVVDTGTAKGPAKQSVYPGKIVFPTEGWTVDLERVVGVDLSDQAIWLRPSR